jgi:hypothetical protein
MTFNGGERIWGGEEGRLSTTNGTSSTSSENLTSMWQLNPDDTEDCLTEERDFGYLWALFYWRQPHYMVGFSYRHHHHLVDLISHFGDPFLEQKKNNKYKYLSSDE